MLFEKIYKRPSRLAAPVLLTVAAAWLSGCAENGVMTPLGPVAAGERAHLISFFLWMLPISLPILIGTPWIAMRYRRHGGKGKYDTTWSHSVGAEVVIWGGATLTFLIVGWLTWGREVHNCGPWWQLARQKCIEQVKHTLPARADRAAGHV